MADGSSAIDVRHPLAKRDGPTVQPMFGFAIAALSRRAVLRFGYSIHVTCTSIPPRRATTVGPQRGRVDRLPCARRVEEQSPKCLALAGSRDHATLRGESGAHPQRRPRPADLALDCRGWAAAVRGVLMGWPVAAMHRWAPGGVHQRAARGQGIGSSRTSSRTTRNMGPERAVHSPSGRPTRRAHRRTPCQRRGRGFLHTASRTWSLSCF